MRCDAEAPENTYERLDEVIGQRRTDYITPW
jgi:hypothetical protein